MPAPIKHTFETSPLTPSEKKTGRPRKPEMPPLPKLALTEYEQEWFEYIVSVLSHQPDITEIDQLYIVPAAVEWIKLFRTYGFELASGEIISQARQHPGTMFNALMDRLSVTRKAREKQPKEEEDPNADVLSRLSQRRAS